MDHQGILGVIGRLSSEAASGRLQVTSGMTEGALFFDRGQLVDARLGKLTGFQAINALASVRDASYNFDPSIAPPVQSSITKSERVLLKDFFGIEADDPEPAHDVDVSWTEDDSPPARVVPLAEVQAQAPLISEDEDEVTLVRPHRSLQNRTSTSAVARTCSKIRTQAGIVRGSFRGAAGRDRCRPLLSIPQN